MPAATRSEALLQTRSRHDGAGIFVDSSMYRDLRRRAGQADQILGDFIERGGAAVTTPLLALVNLRVYQGGPETLRRAQRSFSKGNVP